MKKLFLAGLVVAIAIWMLMPMTRSHTEEALYGQLMTKGTNSILALDRVLKAPGDFSTITLFSASGVAFREKKLEDAGFLFYAAQLRRHFDSALFPPTGTGGNDPMLAIGAIQQELGEQLNPAIMAEPKVYAKAIERVKAWKPKVAANYEPGWEYSRKGNVKRAEEAVADDRKDFINHMSGIAVLLQDPAYFAALQVCQDYNLKFDKNRPSKEAYDTALQSLEKIEKQKSIEGFASVMK